jgi:transcriptional regulator with GAF, ATPase, and Fis domain
MLLADHFIFKNTARSTKEITRVSATSTDMLMSYHWPGQRSGTGECIERRSSSAQMASSTATTFPPNLQGGVRTDRRGGWRFKGILAT